MFLTLCKIKFFIVVKLECGTKGLLLVEKEREILTSKP